MAELQGRNALAGVAGAQEGEQAAHILLAQMFPGKSAADLTEEEKQTISAFSTLAAGLAGGIAGDSSAGVLTGAQAGKNAVENNLLGGGTEEGQAKAVREHAKNIASCSTDPDSASCQKGLAMQDALTVALPAGLGGGIPAAATPEIAAAAQAAIQSCAGNVVLCLNSVGIQVSEAIVPGGVGAGGAVGIGKTVTEATAAKSEAVAANAAKGVISPKNVADELTEISFKQLDKKFKHAEDFGVMTTKKNPETLSQYEAAIRNHMGDTATVEQGSYGFVKDSKVFFNSATNNAVVLDSQVLSSQDLNLHQESRNMTIL
nr:VENN motif pre-toxin domain-containing protein [Franconibacter pulveris]